jgi:guanosine-3',5'-bis(diphosphate) 3'-pyrophosphohydrolase
LIQLKKLVEGFDDTWSEEIGRVYSFSSKYLTKIQRASGESYFQHGIEVALTLKEIIPDPRLVIVAILHDLPVHPQGEKLLLKALLSNFQRKLILDMFQLRHLHIDAEMRDLDLALRSFTKDTRILLLRMAHRLNDMRHIDHFSEDRQQRLASETLHMYTAIASQLGINAVRTELEDRCFLYLFPEIAQKMKKQFQQLESVDKVCLSRMRDFICQKLGEYNIENRVQFRIKGLYSTYRKMLLKNLVLSEVMDRLALRIIVENEEDCYRVLWLVHKYMHPVPEKLTDYIGMPKDNGYRSIHTVIYPFVGVTEVPMEIQIRTHEMEKECEFGQAAHGDYKKIRYALTSMTSRVNLFRNLSVKRDVMNNPDDFEKIFRDYFNERKTMIFDEMGKPYYIDKSFTVLDFVCLQYGEKVIQLKTARVNGRIQHFSTFLRNGDIVHIRFSPENKIKREWLDYCESPSSIKLLSGLLEGEHSNETVAQPFNA